jgi:8-oxo-dGTP diphosphatase
VTEKMDIVKHIQVACAIIEFDGLVLAAQRSGGMSMPLKWEFPGGKIDPGESAEECLRRELVEEMGLHVQVGKCLSVVTYQYPAVLVTLHPFICTITGGEIFLHEHVASVWLPPAELHTLDWAEADKPIIEEYLRGCGSLLQAGS